MNPRLSVSGALWRGLKASSALSLAMIAITAADAMLGEASQAHAAETVSSNPSAPIMLEADHMGYDRDKQIVVALGNVELVQAQTVMFADKLTYYSDQNIVVAEGNVSILREDGNVYMADKIQLKDDMARGVIERFQIYLADNSRLLADKARRLNESEMELKGATYTPCEICEDDDPFWQIRARDIYVDEAEQSVEYTHAWMEFYGVPLLYAPYFSHATPNADRKTGLLTPEYGSSSNFGNTFEVPVYLNVAADKEATVTPTYTTEEGLIVDVLYDQLYDSGALKLNISGTMPDKRDADGNKVPGEEELRGHIFAKGEWRANEDWDIGFDINRSTDDTYLRRYGYTNDYDLTSRVYTEYLGSGRTYFLTEGLAFQGLREEDDQDTIPYILPQLDGYLEEDASQMLGMRGAKWFGHGNMRFLSRDEGEKSQRVSVMGGLSIPYASSGGHLFELTTQLRQDVYYYQDVTVNSQLESGNELRTIPQAALHWRYPLMKRFGSGTVTIEPNIMAVATPSGLNPSEIVDEESRVSEFSDVNFFSMNPFSGLDRVDDSTRIAYGVRTQWMEDGGNSVYATVGQNYLITTGTPFPYSEDPDANISDYFMRLDAALGTHFDASYYGLYRQDTLEARRHELRANLSYDNYAATILYTNAEATNLFDEQDEVYLSGSAYIADEWQATAYTRRDLQGDGRTVSLGYGLNYINDCFRLMLAADRSFTSDRDLEEETSITARIFFRNIDY